MTHPDMPLNRTRHRKKTEVMGKVTGSDNSTCFQCRMFVAIFFLTNADIPKSQKNHLTNEFTFQFSNYLALPARSFLLFELVSHSLLIYLQPPPPRTFVMRPWRVFFLAPRSVSSVPLHHYRSTARLSPALKGMQTHIKRGPLVLKISRLCSSYFLPSYLQSMIAVCW